MDVYSINNVSNINFLSAPKCIKVKADLASKKCTTINENTLREQIKAGMSLPQLAKAHNCSQMKVRNILEVLGLKTIQAQKANNIKREDIEKYVILGYNCREIANIYKISEMQIGNVLKKFGLETNIHKNEKMISKQDIIDMLDAGAKKWMLPEIFGVAEHTISRLFKDFELSNPSSYLKKLEYDKIVIPEKELETIASGEKTITQVTEELGTSFLRVSKALHRYTNYKKGQSVVLPDRKTLYNWIYKDSLTIEEIANDFDVTPDKIREILWNK